MLSFLHFLTRRGITVLFSSESSQGLPDDDLQFMADGVINLEAHPTGAAARVSKFRGSAFLRGEGMKVYPRMEPATAKLVKDEKKCWSSGTQEIDTMLRGGLEAETISLITGPSGIGKSTLATQFAAETARQGHNAAVFLFEEEINSFLRRAHNLEIGLEKPMQDGTLVVELVEPMRYLADEFTAQVCEHVEKNNVEFVILDSVAGFSLTLGGEGVEERLHVFAKTLARMGVTVMLVNETQVVAGQEFRITERGISYLSDNVIFLRYMETDGQLRKAFGVLKKRLSDFDHTLRTYEIGPGGLLLRDGVQGFHAVLSGMPLPPEDG